MTTAYRISCMRSASGELKVQRWQWTKFKKEVSSCAAIFLKIQAFITCHYIYTCIILTSLLYRVRTLASNDTKESENSLESPHLGEIKRMCKQCIPGAPLFFARAPGMRLAHHLHMGHQCKRSRNGACLISIHQLEMPFKCFVVMPMSFMAFCVTHLLVARLCNLL